jgi:hypothetical protein
VKHVYALLVIALLVAPRVSVAEVGVVLSGPGSIAYESDTVDNPSRWDLNLDGETEMVYSGAWNQIKAVTKSNIELWSYTADTAELCPTCGSEPEYWGFWLAGFIDTEPGQRDAVIQYNYYDWNSGGYLQGTILVSTTGASGSVRQVIPGRRIEACVDMDNDGLWEILLAVDSPESSWEVWAYPSLTGAEAQAPLSRGLEVMQNSPNPFNPSTTFSFTLAKSGSAAVEVFDMAGRLVERIDLGHLAAGEHDYTWRGRGKDGKPLASGAYFYSIVSGGDRESRKMMLLK